MYVRNFVLNSVQSVYVFSVFKRVWAFACEHVSLQRFADMIKYVYASKIV